MDQEKFLAERRTMIGASDVGTILGLNPWQSPHQVFMQKLGMDEVEDNEAMAAGRDLEQWIVENRFTPALEKRLNMKFHVLKPPLIRHADHPEFGCHCDGLVFHSHGGSSSYHDCNDEDDPYETLEGVNWLTHLPSFGEDGFITGVEIKNVSQHMYDKEWGEEWTDQIPERYITQCQYSMWVLRSQAKALGIDEPIDDWLVGAFVGGRSFRMHRVVYNEELIQAILPALHKFWDYVTTLTPPPADASPFCTTLWNIKMQERDNEERAEPTPDLDALAEHYLMVKQMIAEREKELDLLKNQMIEKLAGAAVCEGPDWKITWRKSAPRSKINWEKLAEEARIPVKLIAKYTTLKDAERTFRVTRKKGD